MGADRSPQIEGLDRQPGRANYFIGNDPKKWRTNVPTYALVKYRNVYPGIDLAYHGSNQRQLEYDFEVAPGVDPRQIKLSLTGDKRLRLDADGNLVVSIAGGEIVEHRPVIYQDIDGIRRRVTGGFEIRSGQTVGFKLAAYDHSKRLTIDPSLVYSTYLGGSNIDGAYGIAVDSSGNAYITGFTYSTDFPTTAGAFQTTSGGSQDVFVSKLNSGGSALIYSTYLGGSLQDDPAGVAVDSSGNAYVTGETYSSNFPTTAGAFQTTLAGTINGFVSKLNSSGSALVYSTYLGGSNADNGQAIAVDSSGNAYVTGNTDSSNFPTTAGALQTTFGGGSFNAFVTKLDSGGSGLIYSTYLGGSGRDIGRGIAIDPSSNAYVAGETSSSNFPTTAGAFQTTLAGSKNAFVSKVNSGGSALVYSTYLGGSGPDDATGIALDASGNAYVTGITDSSNFPTTAGAFQTTLAGSENAFVSKLNSGGSALVYSTYLGGSNDDYGNGIAVDSSGNAYVIGYTVSSNFPTTAGVFQTALAGTSAAFVSKLNSGGSALTYSTYLGGSTAGENSGEGIAVDSSGNAYVTGGAQSSDFPTTAGAFQTTFGGDGDAFVTKIATDNTPPVISITSPTPTTYTLNQVVAASYSCTDSAGDPVTVCAGPVANGANINTASIGSKTFTVNATDSHNNSASQSVNYNIGYNICTDYDTTHAKQTGSTVPIKLMICDANGVNESASSIVLHATGVILVSTSAPEPLSDSGNANPDDDFRFISGPEYIFNLSTTGDPAGTLALQFTVSGDPTTHSALFQLK
ncbi:MAG: SBBP repeat-containing protein [Candidatus Binataceae bacterium]